MASPSGWAYRVALNAAAPTTTPPAIRQATPEEWNALIAKTPQPTGTATTTRPR